MLSVYAKWRVLVPEYRVEIKYDKSAKIELDSFRKGKNHCNFDSWLPQV